MKVLAGFLASPTGSAAMDRAVEEAWDRGGELHLVAFIPAPVREADTRTYPPERDRMQAKLDAFVDALRDDGLDAHGHLPTGPRKPSDAIISVAEQEGVDLIVIGMRERSRVGKLVLGSNAQDILLRANCAVLSVKPQVHEQA